MHYVYLDLGKKQYFTVALPQNQGGNGPSIKDNENESGNTLFCL